MADVEIDRIRALLAASPRATELSERRKRLDMLGDLSPLPADVRALAVNAGGVAAEWTWTPVADPNRVLHRAMVAEAGRRARARTFALDSPLYADLRGLPPVLIQVGSAETLLDDSVRLAGALALADVAVTLEVYPDMIHVWPLFFGSVAAGRSALTAGGRFMHGAE